MDEKITRIEQKVTSNEQKVSSNKQKLTSNEQRLTSNEQNVTSNEQNVTSNEQNLTCNKQKLTSNEQIVTSNEQKLMSNDHKVTSNEQKVMRNEQNVTYNEHKVTNNEQKVQPPQFNEDFVKHYNEESDEGFFLEVHVQYFEKLHHIHNDLAFLPERMKIKKVEKLVVNLHDKTEYVLHIKNLKRVWNHDLVLKKFIEWLNLIKILIKTIYWYNYFSIRTLVSVLVSELFSIRTKLSY